MRKALRVGIYARVSTVDQQTIPQQLRALKRYVKERGWLVTHQVEDIGSGAATRPKREELLQLARRREIDVILVWSLDRWGRSLRDLVTTIEELSEVGVSFVSLTEALDFTTSTGRAMAGMIAVIAQFERDILRE